MSPSQKDMGMPLVFLNSHPIQYFAPLYRYLFGEGIPLEVVYYSGNEPEKFDTEFNRQVQWDIDLLDGYPHRFLPNKGGAPGKKGFRSLYNPGIVSYFRKKEKSLVVIHSWQYSTDWLAILAAKWYGHRLAFWTEANHSFESKDPALRRLIKRLRLLPVFRAADHFFFIGQQNRDFYRSFGIAERKLVYAPYAVDNDRFQSFANATDKEAARLKTGLPAGSFIVLFAAKYISKKRPLDLLAAFARLDLPKMHLVMVGEGTLRPAMEEYIREQGLSGRVTLTGFVNQSSIPLYYAAADAFVMCSGIGETWGLSVNEAMNFSLPLVVSDLTGCSADLVKEAVNGFVFKTGDIDAMAAALRRLATLSSQQLEEMGKQSLSLVNQFSYERFLQAVRLVRGEADKGKTAG